MKTRMTGLMLCLALTAWNAFADNNKGGFETQLVGSAPGEHVAGIASSSTQWKVADGEVKVSTNGSIDVEIKGLLFAAGPNINTVGPVTMVDASLVCGDVVAATTKAFALTTVGNAELHDTIRVPSPCIAPAVLIRLAATTTGPVANGFFIAVNTLSNGGQEQGHGKD
jgi:hypothetical protein